MRKCACGSGKGAGLDDQCTKCRGKRIQRKPSTAAPTRGFDVSNVALSAPADRSEREADRAADHAVNALGGRAAGSPPATAAAAHDAPAQVAANGLIVDDETELLATGQMRKLGFLAELRTASCDAADRVLAQVGRSTDGCPMIAKWIGTYERREAALVERAIHKYAPETRFAASAHAYIPLVAARIARGVQSWAITGKVPDLPPELAGAMTGGGVLGALAGIGSMLGRAARAIGSLFRSPDGDAPGGDVDRGATSDRLGDGTPLEPSVRGQMEDAFGHGFGDVRVHADPSAASLSRDLGARAFTIGSHVAFGSGEYRPGTVAGDALLAHELAHVVQQTGGSAMRDSEPSPAHEEDADAAALDAVSQLHGKRDRRDGRLVQQRSGLGLQRCNSDVPKLPDEHAKDQLAGTHLPNPTEQKNLMGDLGIQPPGPPKSAADAAASKDEPEVSEEAKIAGRLWDGVEQPGIDKEHAEKNRARLADQLRGTVDDYLSDHPVKEKTQVPLKQFEGACQAAKAEADAYFGGWVTADRKQLNFEAEKNLLSAYDFEAMKAKGIPVPTAAQRIMKIVDSTDVGQAVTSKHFFQRNRSNEERVFFATILTELAKDKDRADKLIAYSKWAGISRPFPDHRGLFLANDDASDAMKWEVFGICAHEYIHTLAHPAFTAATARASSDVPLEGFTHMFTKELLVHALPRIASDDALREKVQGHGGSADTSLLEKWAATVYTDVTHRAEHMRQIAGSPVPTGGGCKATPTYAPGGFNAVKAAYFLGHVELIGLSPSGAPGPTAATPDEVSVPDKVETVEQLAQASGVPAAEILDKNPRLRTQPKLTAGDRVTLPGCRMHVVIADKPDQSPPVSETKAQIAQGNGVSPDDLDRGNPGLIGKWEPLALGQRILVPRH